MNFYKSATSAFGEAGVLRSMRLFMAPGMGHCGGGEGPNTFDMMVPLEQWVEKGQAPDVLIARRLANGAVERSRPVYPYPIRARFLSGNPKDASSFVPFDPARP